jgi:hypothetical protein
MMAGSIGIVYQSVCCVGGKKFSWKNRKKIGVACPPDMDAPHNTVDTLWDAPADDKVRKRCRLTHAFFRHPASRSRSRSQPVYTILHFLSVLCASKTSVKSKKKPGQKTSCMIIHT